jgi:MurNAc alpha-1-phosphate uridylyltransferase
MVMAAGLGTRMRPLTLDRPKALVNLAGRPLIDHVLDRLAAAGVRRAVVNAHAFADALETHLGGRRDLDIIISDEREALLETAGGLKAARGWLGDDPILVANIDTVWLEAGEQALERLIGAWDNGRMDDLILLARLEHSLGFDGPGDFFLDDQGRLTHRGDAAAAPYAAAGVHMLDPRLIDDWEPGRAGMFARWMQMIGRERLHGVVMDGLWMHVGDPVARQEAEARLAATL